ncbi:Major facilitator superfamily domain general substrate transporter [Penicillium herquei]|nr:Major facilitator superfamily domain general substrate transporter [Penicillium herquei]
MSLNRVSFLEGWERNPAAFLRGREDPPSDTDDDTFQDLPDTSSLSSSFPSTYSRLNFNPYAGPGWNETVDDRDDRPSLLGSLGLGLSPTTTRETQVRVDPLRPASPAAVAGVAGPPKDREPASWSGTTGAFEVSPAKRIAQVCLAVVYCFLAAGIVFGFAALKPVLIRENVYRNLCSQQELEDNVGVCDGQEIRLNLMFTIAAVATNVSALPIGTILDAYGPRVCGIIGSICLAAGAILFGSAHKLAFDGYIPGYLLLSLGGPFIFISSFQLSNTFPRRSGLILSMLTGAFDASSALFLIFRLLSEHTQGSISVQKFFLVYLLVPIFIIAVQLTVMPATSYKTTGELVLHAEVQVIEEINDRVDDSIHDRHESERQRNDRRMRRQSIVHHIQDLLDDDTASIVSGGINEAVFNPQQSFIRNDNDNQPTVSSGAQTPKPQLQPQPTPPNTSGVWGVLHGKSALRQLATPWFILITLFTILMMLRINYFVATLHSQYTSLLDPTQARAINNTFDILLPVGGLVSIPFIGTFLDTLRTRTVLSILVATATAIGVLGCIPHSLGAAYGNIILFVLYRPFYYTAVSDYAAKVFGFQTFGKVYGLIICLAGVGNFAQAGLDAITLGQFDGDPVPVNVGLTAAVAIVGASLVGFVSWQTSLLLSKEQESQIQTRDLHIATTIGDSMRSGNGGRHPDVVSRDWEREPLLIPQGESRRYGS